MYLKDSDGKKSATVTMSIITFAVVMLKVLVGGTSFTIGGISVAFGNIGADEILALMGPTLGAYSFRRYTDRRFDYENAEPPMPGEGDGGESGPV